MAPASSRIEVISRPLASSVAAPPQKVLVTVRPVGQHQQPQVAVQLGHQREHAVADEADALLDTGGIGVDDGAA